MISSGLQFSQTLQMAPLVFFESGENNGLWNQSAKVNQYLLKYTEFLY